MRQNQRRINGLLAATALLALTLILTLTGRERPADQPVGSATWPERLLLAGLWADPLRTSPAESVERAVERAARGAIPVPYFADEAESLAFRERWAGRVIDGRARLAEPERFNRIAQTGRTAPVLLWLDDGRQVMGLQGTARFAPAAGGHRIERLDLTPLPLAVRDWRTAAAVVEGREGRAGRTAAPFSGRFFFADGDRQWAVDARTGEVIAP